MGQICSIEALATSWGHVMLNASIFGNMRPTESPEEYLAERQQRARQDGEHAQSAKD